MSPETAGDKNTTHSAESAGQQHTGELGQITDKHSSGLEPSAGPEITHRSSGHWIGPDIPFCPIQLIRIRQNSHSAVSFISQAYLSVLSFRQYSKIKENMECKICRFINK